MGVKKVNKWMAVVLSVLLLASVLGGCGNNGGKAVNEAVGEVGEAKAGEEKAVAMGRYTEESLKLPELEKGEEVFTLVDAGGEILLYSKRGNETFREHVMQQGGTWASGEALWLNQAMEGRGKSVYVRQIMVGGDGFVYAWFMDGDYLPHIVKKTGSDMAEELKLPDIVYKDLDNNLNGFAITAGGEMILSFFSSRLVLYSSEDGSEVREFKQGQISTDNICNWLVVKGDKLITVSENGKGFIVYHLETGEVVDEIPYRTEEAVSKMFIVKGGSKEDYYYLSRAGVNRFMEGGTLVETVVDGSLNTIGIEGVVFNSFIVGKENDYYILFQDDGSTDLVHYVYRADVPTVPATQLTLYGLEKNKAVARAIGTFQKANPDVQITYYTADLGEGAATLSDSIRTLNVELLSGKGADLLLLDGLPVESYIEKGVLADISDIIRPAIDAGDLLENIINPYQRDESGIYSVPVRFGMPIFIGDGEAIEAFGSMDSLLPYVTADPENGFLRENWYYYSYGEIAEYLLNIYSEDIITDGSKIKKEMLVQLLDTTMQVGGLTGAGVTPTAIPPSKQEEVERFVESANYQQKSAFRRGTPPIEKGIQSDYIEGLFDMMLPAVLKSDYGKEIASVNHLFIPQGMVGVNAASQEIDIAKAFIQSMLSETEQDKDVGGGLPVNVKSLEKFSEKKVEGMYGLGYEDRGKEVRLSYESPTKEQIMKFTDLAATLTIPLNIDRALREMILNGAEPYFAGSVSKEKAVEDIMNKAGTYLAE